jgi:hypothetical protein
MFGKGTYRGLMMLALATSVGMSVSACGGGNTGPKMAQVKAGEMPAGGDWTGVYYDTYFGYLHMVKDGNTVTGAWRTTAGDEWGELSGEVDGNVLKYSWTDHKIGMVGPSANRSGKGYFVYKIPKEGEAHQVEGQRGMGDDEAGQNWKGVKQTNMPPDPKSVRPDEIEGRVNAGGWDDDGGGAEGGGAPAGGGSAPAEGGDKGGQD